DVEPKVVAPRHLVGEPTEVPLQLDELGRDLLAPLRELSRRDAAVGSGGERLALRGASPADGTSPGTLPAAGAVPSQPRQGRPGAGRGGPRRPGRGRLPRGAGARSAGRPLGRADRVGQVLTPIAHLITCDGVPAPGFWLSVGGACPAVLIV